VNGAPRWPRSERAARKGAASALFVLLVAGCELEPGSEGSGAPAPDAATGAAEVERALEDADPDSGRATDASVNAEGGLDLALLAPLPEFVDPARDRPGASGHVADHGDLAEPTAATARALDAVALSWSTLSAPDYESPALMASVERPPLEQVIDGTVLAASGRRVVLDGFGTVDRRAGDAVVELMLTPLPLSCCLGGFPAAGGRVHVRVDPALRLEVDPWTPLRLVGRFDVEERRDELGLFEGLYFLEVERASDVGVERR
jgi:hypothetical protein